jgi:hypothetical protein
MTEDLGEEDIVGLFFGFELGMVLKLRSSRATIRLMPFPFRSPASRSRNYLEKTLLMRDPFWPSTACGVLCPRFGKGRRSAN